MSTKYIIYSIKLLFFILHIRFREIPAFSRNLILRILDRLMMNVIFSPWFKLKVYCSLYSFCYVSYRFHTQTGMIQVNIQFKRGISKQPTSRAHFCVTMAGVGIVTIMLPSHKLHLCKISHYYLNINTHFGFFKRSLSNVTLGALNTNGG